MVSPMGQHTRQAVTTRRPDPEAWRTALELADGDVSRLQASDDGRTVVILNSPRR
jgi:hypothetical protein